MTDTTNNPGDKPDAKRPDEEKLALDHLISLFYEKLRRRASFFRRKNPSATLNSTALVNEALMRLKRSPQLASMTEEHFKNLTDNVMENILVDAARRRGAKKRGGWGEQVMMNPDEIVSGRRQFSLELLTHEVGLDVLEKVNPRQADIVRGRVFRGMTVKELGAKHGISDTTVEREWRAARAWLEARNRPKRKE